MTPSPKRDSNTEQALRLERVVALTHLVAVQSNQMLSYRDIGGVVHELGVAVDNDSVNALATIRLRFTVRDGWSSPELTRAVEDACAVAALVSAVGGVLHLGPQAGSYLDPRAAAGRHLLSVPSAAAAN